MPRYLSFGHFSRNGIVFIETCCRIPLRLIAARARSVVSLAILRVVLVCHALAVFTQAALAGQFLSGSDSAVEFHESTGWIILAISLIQAITAAVFMRSRITSLWLVLGSIIVFLAEGLQVGTG
jgi:hypothetical protein